MSRTKRLSFDFFPGYIDQKLSGQNISAPFVSGSNAVLVGIRYAVILPLPKVRSISAFTFLDPNGGEQQLGRDEYIADLASEPARLTPVFGQVWPVARVQVNAVWVDYVSGYGGPVTVSTAGDSTQLAGYVFSPDDVGAAISIPGAGASGKALMTTIADVDDNGVATLEDEALASVANAQAWLGDPIPMAVQLAIMMLTNAWYENRGVVDEAPAAVKALLGPYRDIRL